MPIVRAAVLSVFHAWMPGLTFAAKWIVTVTTGGRIPSRPHRPTDNSASIKQHNPDGAVPSVGAVGSIVFAPQEAKRALRRCTGYPELYGEYGFKDAYNLDVVPHWLESDYIGIDKGVTFLMIGNYRCGFVWEAFMKSLHSGRGLFRTSWRNLDVRESAPCKTSQGYFVYFVSIVLPHVGMNFFVLQVQYSVFQSN